MAKQRRGKGEGGLFQRGDGLWCAYITLPNSPDGKRRRRYVYGRDKADVRHRFAQLQMRSTTEPLKPHADRTTLAVLLSTWIASLDVRDATARQYRWIVTQYLVPRLGHVRLESLDAAAIEGFFAALREEGVGARTRQLCYDTLRIPLRRAVRAGTLARNPIEPVSRPRYQRTELTPWSAEEARAVVEASRSDRFHALYVVALRLGLQFPGEILGLRWSDLDLKRRELYLSTQLARGRSAPTKTDARRRRLALPGQVVDALAAHRAQILAEGLRATEWVFPDGAGNPQSSRNFVRDSYDKVVARAGVRRIRPYAMRHTFATLALIAGVHPKIVSEILGHSTIELTLRTYQSVLPGMQDDAVARLDVVWAATARQFSDRQGVRIGAPPSASVSREARKSQKP